jgi:hypothetical protein
MPEVDANVHPRSLAGAGTGEKVEPAELLVLARYLDVVFIVIAAPVALALGAATLGVVIGLASWLLQRAAALLARRLIVKAAEPGSRLGLNFADAFARIWLLAGGIVAAGVIGGRRDGLAAALLIFATYSVAFALRLARGRAGGPA